MEYIQLTLDDWIQMKQKLRQELIGVKQSFVRIGYALRQIEDQKLYERDGYSSIAEFAQAEYGLGASITSRFMSINREYSIDGYSEHLRPEYAELGRSQLEEMLKLPDADRQMVQPETQREDIRELKRFNKTEPAAGEADDITQLVEKFYHDNKDTLNAVYTEEFDEQSMKRFAEIVNPGGNRSFKKGLYFMMMYENRISIKKFGSTPRDMTWWEFYQITKEIFDESAAGDKTWQVYFKEEEEKNDEIAPAQNAAPLLEIKEKSETESATNPLNTLENTSPLLEISEKHDSESATNALNTFENAAPLLEISEKHDSESATNGLNAFETTPQHLEVSEKDSSENEEFEENEIAPAQDTEVIEAIFGTRKEYMDHLSAQEMAEYMSEEYKNRRLRVPDLAYPSNLYAWLTEKVDRFGKLVENE